MDAYDKSEEFRVVSDHEWTEALGDQRVKGSDQHALMTHILPSISPDRSGEQIDIMAFFAIPATLAYEIAAVVVGVVAADVVDNIVDRKFPEPRPAPTPTPTPQKVMELLRLGGKPADFQVAALPPIPAMRSLSPHRGVPG